MIYLLDKFFLSRCIYFGTFNGGKSSFENYFIQTQDMKFRIRGNAIYIFQFVSWQTFTFTAALTFLYPHSQSNPTFKTGAPVKIFEPTWV